MGGPDLVVWLRQDTSPPRCSGPVSGSIPVQFVQCLLSTDGHVGTLLGRTRAMGCFPVGPPSASE